MPGIFIGYRRADSSEHAAKVYKQLCKYFGKDHVFMDVGIEPGDKFKQEIDDVLEKSDFFISIIGKIWLTVKDDYYMSRRLEDPFDFVRRELEFAINNQLEIIPVLVDGTPMPHDRDLPGLLSRLPDFQAIELTSKSAKPEVDRIINIVNATREKKQQKRDELTEALIQLTCTPNHSLNLGEVRIIHYEDESSGLFLHGFLPLSVFSRLSRKFYDLVNLGVSIEARGDKKPYSAVGRIKWKVQQDNRHIHLIIEDILTIFKLAEDTSLEKRVFQLEKWLDR